MSVHHLQSAFTSSNQPRGPVVPVTMFMQVSSYPDAATAFAAYEAAKSELAAIEPLYRKHNDQIGRMYKDIRRRQLLDCFTRRDVERYENNNDFAELEMRYLDAEEHLQAVESRMGLFHPKHRALLAGWVESAIGLLDNLDGNPDEEEETLEDAFVVHDPAFAMMDSDGRDVAWPEWHTRGRHKVSGFGAEMVNSMVHEDDEDDDPDTGVEDGPFDGEEDKCSAGDDGCGPVWVNGYISWGSGEDCEAAFAHYGLDQTQPGMPPDLFAEHAMMKPHLQRARRRLKIVD